MLDMTRLLERQFWIPLGDPDHIRISLQPTNDALMLWREDNSTLSIDLTRSIIEDEEDILDGLEQTKVGEIRCIMYILDWLIDHDWFTILWY